MKKSHKWIEYESISARCPHCRIWSEHDGPSVKGDIIQCEWCHKNFELGRQT